MSGDPQDITKSKGKAPRARTGCITCKIRRIKCDETKPACLRCTSTGRKCDGYLTKERKLSSRPKHAVPKESASQSSSTPSSIRARSPAIHALTYVPRSASKTGVEIRFLEFFYVRTAPALSGFIKDDFWKQVVRQLGISEPPITQAMTAVAAYHQRFDQLMQSDIGQPIDEPYAVDQYNKAISALVTRLSTSQDTFITLVACLLFTCLEMLRGNERAALGHITSGAGIVASYRKSLAAQAQNPTGSERRWQEVAKQEIIETQIAPIFTRLSILSMLFGSHTAYELLGSQNGVEFRCTVPGWPAAPESSSTDSLSDFTPSFPTPFRAIEDARYALLPIVERVIAFIRTNLAARFARKIEPAAMRGHLRLELDLETWTEEFSILARSLNIDDSTVPPTAPLSISHDDLHEFVVLSVFALMIGVWLAASLTPREDVFDSFLPQFRKSLALCKFLEGEGQKSRLDQIEGAGKSKSEREDTPDFKPSSQSPNPQFVQAQNIQSKVPNSPPSSYSRSRPLAPKPTGIATALPFLPARKVYGPPYHSEPPSSLNIHLSSHPSEDHIYSVSATPQPSFPEFLTDKGPTPSPPPNGTPKTPREAPFFTFEMGIICPLYLLAIKCRHPRIRREACDLLKRSTRREGLWNAAAMGAVAERLIEVEEQGWRLDSDLLNSLGRGGTRYGPPPYEDQSPRPFEFIYEGEQVNRFAYVQPGMSAFVHPDEIAQREMDILTQAENGNIPGLGMWRGPDGEGMVVSVAPDQVAQNEQRAYEMDLGVALPTSDNLGEIDCSSWTSQGMEPCSFPYEATRNHTLACLRARNVMRDPYPAVDQQSASSLSVANTPAATSDSYDMDQDYDDDSQQSQRQQLSLPTFQYCSSWQTPKMDSCESPHDETLVHTRACYRATATEKIQYPLRRAITKDSTTPAQIPVKSRLHSAASTSASTSGATASTSEPTSSTMNAQSSSTRRDKGKGKGKGKGRSRPQPSSTTNPTAPSSSSSTSPPYIPNLPNTNTTSHINTNNIGDDDSDDDDFSTANYPPEWQRVVAADMLSDRDWRPVSKQSKTGMIVTFRKKMGGPMGKWMVWREHIVPGGGGKGFLRVVEEEMDGTSAGKDTWTGNVRVMTGTG
ncbi:hypothetical protein MMC25_001693 [Agyrium rufum]|nr:hypothetical protein [Agyrium rufum]